MRAIYYALPKSWDSTRSTRKQSQVVQQRGGNTYEADDVVRIQNEIKAQLAPKIQWKYDFKQKLMELIVKEDDGLLATYEARNPIYSDIEMDSVVLFDTTVALRPIFYRAASIHKQSMMDTPPPGTVLANTSSTNPNNTDTGNNATGLSKHSSMRSGYDYSDYTGTGSGSGSGSGREHGEETVIDSNLDGFSLLSPQRTNQYHGNDTRTGTGTNDGGTFMDEGDSDDSDDDANITMLSPQTPHPGHGHAMYDTPPYSNGFGSGTGDDHYHRHNRSGETTSSSVSSHSHSQSAMSPLADSKSNNRVKNTVTRGGFMGDSPGDDTDGWDMTMSPLPDALGLGLDDEVEEDVENEGQKDGWTDDKIEAAMAEIALEEQRQGELEREMELEIQRSRELKSKQKEKILVRAATMYNNEVSKAVRRASLTPLASGRNSPVNGTLPGGMSGLSGVSGLSDIHIVSPDSAVSVVVSNTNTDTEVATHTTKTPNNAINNTGRGINESKQSGFESEVSYSTEVPSTSTIESIESIETW